MANNKQDQLIKVRQLVQNVAEFLVDYLPFANAHNSDFFVHQHWECFVPSEIASDLLSLTLDQLACLPAHVPQHLSCQCDDQTDSAGEATAKPKKKLHVCRTPHSQKAQQLKPKWDMSLRPHWQHKRLGQFVTAAQKHMLPNLNVLTDLDKLLVDLCQTNNSEDKLTINNFMSTKKSYEVDVMAQLCTQITVKYNIQKVIDIGSGRGYLGCQLSLMHGLSVLGIDSSTTNTASAVTRSQRLNKHWNGLVRNAKEDAERGFKIRRGKNYRGKVRKRQRSTTTDDASNVTAEASDYDMDVSLERIFRESSPSPPSASPPPGSPETTEKSDAKASESLVVYLSEPRVRRPRLDSSSRFSPAKDTNNLYHPITHYVTVDTDLHELVKAHLGIEAADSKSSGENINPESIDKSKPVINGNATRLMLTGLHTCGNLASSVLQLFTSNPRVTVLCNVACCYHLIEEEFMRNPYLEDGEPDYEEVGFPLSHHLRHQACQLGRNARMLASQAIDRAATATKLPGKSLLWRAILQVILRDVSGGECRQDWQVGKLANKCKDFTEYVHKALAKLGIQDELSSTDIQAYEHRYEGEFHKLQAFVQLRAVLAPCIEALILLDRLLFLYEQDCIEDSHLVQLFDPVKSPRCYALFACKTSALDPPNVGSVKRECSTV